MATKIPHILVVGSLNTDLVTRTPVVPTGGETLTASSFSTGSGGKGANQAVACARSSRSSHAHNELSQSHLASVSMIGAVGDDVYGRQLLEELSGNGVNVDRVAVIDGEVSGVAVIIVEESSGENRILITPGANKHVVPQAFESFVAQTQPDIVVLQLEIPIDTVLSIIESAKKLGINVILNPAPALPLPESALNGLSHLVMNETEARILAGWGGDVVNDDNLRKVFTKFQSLGVKNTIVTLGGSGVAYQTGLDDFSIIPAHKVEKVVDTTAAGDTFVGAFAVEVSRMNAAGSTLDIKAAVDLANRAAARTVEKAGSMKSIPWRDEV